MSENKPQLEQEEINQEDEISGDSFLNLMVHLAEKGAGASLTIFTSGQCFTGLLCSKRQYLEASMQLTAATAYSTIFKEVLSALKPDEDNGPAPDYHYIHLLKGRVIAPGGSAMPTDGVPLRIERDAVVAWHMGELQASI